jgi:Na+/H+ antiporter NhaD/arsenite permease-like protein
MIPVLEYMEHSAKKMGLTSEAAFYWGAGLVSALLDNAPTYLAFFAAALGLHGFDINEPLQVAAFIRKNGGELTALSLGATFFGALTYVGNAPNLIVKTIAEHAGVPTPSFVGYIWKFSIPILIPVFALISILFFSR